MKKNVFISVLAGSVIWFYGMSVSADEFGNMNMLKRGLVLLEAGNGQYRISDYNTNDDTDVNVLDLVRLKQAAIESVKPGKQNITVSLDNPWIDDDKAKIIVPVSFNGTYKGISNLSFDVKYNSMNFTLSNVYTYSDGKVLFSRNSNHIQYAAPDGQNTVPEGNLLYLVFSVAQEVKSPIHEIELTDIQAAVIESNGLPRELGDDECPSSAGFSFEFSRTEVSESDILRFKLDNAELSQDGRSLRIPVYMSNNHGIGSFSAVVEYDRTKFKLAEMQRGDFDGYGYIGGNSDNAVFNMNNGQNALASDGVYAYLRFDINDRLDNKAYDFKLKDIKASYYENWNQKPVDKCREQTDTYSYQPGETIPAVTEQPAETTVTTVSDPPVWTEPVVSTTKYVPETTQAVPNTNNSFLDDMEIEVVNLVNSYRSENGVRELTPDDLMSKAAEIRAKELVKDFDSDRDPADVFKEVGVRVMTYSSIETATQKTAATAFNRIKLSGSESALDKSYSRIGVAHIYDSSSRYKDYWVIYFGS